MGTDAANYGNRCSKLWEPMQQAKDADVGRAARGIGKGGMAERRLFPTPQKKKDRGIWLVYTKAVYLSGFI